MVAVDRVEVTHEPLDPGVRGVVEQVPVEAARLGPLGALGQLVAHEGQLLARVCPLVREERADPGELLPVVSGHLAQQRALAVHDLVVADRQHELLGVGVHQRERRLVVVVPPVDGLLGQVPEGVVHPPHVPLEAEAEPATVGRLRDAGPRGRLLGDHHDPGGAAVGRRVGLLQERDRLEVLAAAVDVRSPLAGLAGVVEVEHRGHGVDAQRVDVELLEPVRRVGDEEVAHLGPTEVEHVGAPVLLLTEHGVRVLVERGPVEAGQSPRVLGEVRGDPVDDHADPRLVERVDEEPEVVRVPEA